MEPQIIATQTNDAAVSERALATLVGVLRKRPGCCPSVRSQPRLVLVSRQPLAKWRNDSCGMKPVLVLNSTVRGVGPRLIFEAEAQMFG